MSKTTGTILGIAIIIVGIIIAIFGLTNFLGAASNMQDFGGSFSKSALGIIMIFVGVLIAGAGGMIIYLTNIGKIFSYMAKEAAPGTEKITHAVGKGLASGIKKGLKEK